MSRRSIDEIFAAVIAEEPRPVECVDVACYIARVDGRWSFKEIAEASGLTSERVLSGLNRISIALRRENLRNTRYILERARKRLEDPRA
jgi:hypothetical protein